MVRHWNRLPRDVVDSQSKKKVEVAQRDISNLKDSMTWLEMKYRSRSQLQKEQRLHVSEHC